MAPRRQASFNDQENTTPKEQIKLSIEKYNPNEEGWTYYRQRFLVELRLNDINNEHTKRDLLLSRVGAEAFKILVDYARPNDVGTYAFDTLLTVLNDYYALATCSLGERVAFTNCVRHEDENINQFCNTLKAKAANCGFGESLKERLRDQFIVGIANNSWQKELLRVHSDVDSSWEDVVKTAITLQNVDKTYNQLTAHSNEHQKNTFRIAPSNDTTKHSFKIKNRNNNKTVILRKGIDCLNCGRKMHKSHETCPAFGKKCFECGILNHFGSCCVKNNKATINKQNNKTYHVRRSESTDSSSSSTDDYLVTNKICSLHEGTRAMLSIKINNIKVKMLYDPGAASSVISKHLWEKIGSPALKRTTNLTAYTGIPITCLGEGKVRVHAFGKRLKLPIIVIERDDTPLFGMNWVLSFDLPLPPGAQICTTSIEEPPFDKIVNDLTTKYPKVFSNEIGTMAGHLAVIHISNDAKPKVFKPRPIPFALREGVEREISRLVSLGVLEQVNTNVTPVLWASPIVVKLKSNNEIRICGDYKVTINPYIYVEPHPLPRFEEIVDKLRGGNQFTVLDLKDAYLQMKVHPDSQDLLVVSTHLGFFRYKRLVFGIASATAIFQKAMDQILTGIPGVGWFLDDIIITGSTTEEHTHRVRMVLDRLDRVGIKLKLEKCKWFQNSVKYLGHQIDNKGIHPTMEHLDAMKNMPDPTNVKQLRSFLGTINYYQKFIPNLQCISTPLHRLLQKGVRWHWNENYKNIVQRLKNTLCSTDTLIHFDPKYPIIVSTDASEDGLGATLFHKLPDGMEKPVIYASRGLKPCEKKYSVIDREALGIIFALKKFHQYLYGHEFILRTDHKPLVNLFGEHSELPKVTSDRMTRWALILSSYNYKIEYINTKNNMLADVLSRLPLPNSEEQEELDFGKTIFNIKAEQIQLSRKNLRGETATDIDLQKVIQWIETGWPEKVETDCQHRRYFDKRDELSYEHGVILWKGRLVIPKTLQKSVLKVIHEGHPGITAMKSFARLNVWWPNIDKVIEEKVKSCKGCQQNRPADPDTTLLSWTVPNDVWTRLHVDFAGPFEGNYWLVVVDATSKWIEIVPMKSITTTKTITSLMHIFARFGYPRVIVSDNGPQFTSKLFNEFCTDNNVKHIKSFPYHPKSNGLAERTVRTFKTRYSASKQDNLDFDTRLTRFLLSYRTTVHSATHRTPADILMGRQIHTKLSLLKPNIQSVVEDKWTKDEHIKNKPMEEYKGGNNKWKEFNTNQAVWVLKNNRKGYLEGKILKQIGRNSYLVDIDGIQHRRHADQLRYRLELGERGDV